MRILMYITAFLGIISCSEKEHASALFSPILSEQSGITFSNTLTYTEGFNPYVFKNFYNGGGVAIGDLNNDGLLDIYLCGNQVENKLYINKGNLEFVENAQNAGVSCPEVWSSGVALVDINSDGWLDIYVCKSGSPEDKGVRHNELFINQQDGTFVENSKKYGLDFLGLSTHAAFFDYDLDGDLDCYLLNNSIRTVGAYDLIENQRLISDSLGGNALLENQMNTKKDGKVTKNNLPYFVNVSDKAGIYTSEIGFGLGVSLGDLNNDGCPDIYVSNDFFERDYLYINNCDGTFDESLEKSITELSMGSMGADIADLNNDGNPEIFVTEMLPKTLERVKSKAVFETWDKYQRAVKKGYYHQFARNAFQLNNGTTHDGVPLFSEVSRLTGTHATEWSWGALIADFDHNGYKDVFVANGIGKDLLDQDYVNFYFTSENIRNLIKEKGEIMVEMFDAIPSQKVKNQLFLNRGKLIFEDDPAITGISATTFSNGAAYGDLDNDGDLDLIINNINEKATLLQNNTNDSTGINLSLTFSDENRFAIGAKVTLHAGSKKVSSELFPHRGFQSSVPHRLHLVVEEKIDSLVIRWPDNTYELISELPDPVNGVYNLSSRTTESRSKLPKSNPLLSTIDLLDYLHQENDYSDFDREKLSYFMRSNYSPSAVIGDVNNDGYEDLIIGGAREQELEVLLGTKNGRMNKLPQSIFKDFRSGEVISMSLFDIDGDYDLDLYVGNGSNELPQSSSALKDRIFLNDGKGVFSLDKAFNAPYTPTSTTTYWEDNGGKYLFVGTSEVPFNYGISPQSFVYKIIDKQLKLLYQGKDLGLVKTSTVFKEDDSTSIIIGSDYKNLQKLQIKNGEVQLSNVSGIETIQSWWNCVKASDVDNDGDQDLIAFSYGDNLRYKPSSSSPLVLYINDFDKNRSIEQILCVRKEGKDYPLALKDQLISQLPYLKKKFIKYEAYSSASMNDIFSNEKLSESMVLSVNDLSHSIFYNDNGNFRQSHLPTEFQHSIIMDGLLMDINDDGKQDIIAGGNQYRIKPEMGINAASYGSVALNEDGGIWNVINPKQSGFVERGEIRKLVNLNFDNKRYVIVLKNNAKASSYLLPSQSNF